jgi:ABC-2 type transport system ATP-binding protein
VIVAELCGVTKRFGAVVALDGVDLAVGEGAVLALLGPNGAGKSTAISVLAGLRVPDAGRARLYGLDPRQTRARRRLGVAPQETAFPPTLRTRELVELVRAHYPAPCSFAGLADRFALGPLLTRQLGGLSTGERRRVAVALAFAGAPDLIVLDEPTTGLDSAARRLVWEAVRAHASGDGTVLLSTHHLEEAEALARDVVLLEAGRVVLAGTVAELTAAAGLTLVSFRAPANVTVAGAERVGDRLRLAVQDGGGLVEQLVRDGVPLEQLEVRPLTLEEALAARAGRW